MDVCGGARTLPRLVQAPVVCRGLLACRAYRARKEWVVSDEENVRGRMPAGRCAKADSAENSATCPRTRRSYAAGLLTCSFRLS